MIFAVIKSVKEVPDSLKENSHEKNEVEKHKQEEILCVSIPKTIIDIGTMMVK